MTRCRFCRRSDGVLIRTPASDDYIRARRGYRAIGFGPSAHHAECLADFAAFEAASVARINREREEQAAEIRRALDEMRRESR